MCYFFDFALAGGVHVKPLLPVEEIKVSCVDSLRVQFIPLGIREWDFAFELII